jgi:hypothetical protein
MSRGNVTHQGIPEGASTLPSLDLDTACPERQAGLNASRPPTGLILALSFQTTAGGATSEVYQTTMCVFRESPLFSGEVYQTHLVSEDTQQNPGLIGKDPDAHYMRAGYASQR